MFDIGRRQSLRRIGVSLIEMMIVVAIIGVLVALLIPAIQSVRNAAKKAQNQNNMKQILLAMQTYISQNNGNLPQPSGWPGEACYGTPTYSGTAYQTGWTATTVCATGGWFSPLVSQSVSVFTNTGTPTPKSGTWSTTFVYNNAYTRSDWTDGTPFFLLLPHMDYQNLWDASFGPMSNGALYKSGEPGSWHCPAADWVCSSGCWCTGNEYWVPQNLTDVNTVTSSKVNFGWQGGRNPTLVKAFLGYGDPTSEYPGMPAPLSYPMMGNFGGLIENYNTSYQAVITESYAGCTTGTGSSVNLNTGTYNSWAGASSILNIDFDPIPMTPGYAAVTGGATSTTGYQKIWTGVVTPDTQCDFWAVKYDHDHTSASGSKMMHDCRSTVIMSDPNFPQGIVDEWGRPFTTATTAAWNNANAAMTLIHVPSSGTIRTGGGGVMIDTQHAGEWYYNWAYLITNSNFWLDHPSPNGCVTGEAMSMVPGSLNIGFLDGSVKAIGKDITREAWNAFLAGQAPTDNVENW